MARKTTQNICPSEARCIKVVLCIQDSTKQPIEKIFSRKFLPAFKKQDPRILAAEMKLVKIDIIHTHDNMMFCGPGASAMENSYLKMPNGLF